MRIFFLLLILAMFPSKMLLVLPAPSSLDKEIFLLPFCLPDDRPPLSDLDRPIATEKRTFSVKMQFCEHRKTTVLVSFFM